MTQRCCDRPIAPLIQADAMEAIDWLSVFDAAAQAPNGDEIVSPGAAGLQVLFEFNSITITEAQIQGVYKERGWRSDHSLSKTDFRQPPKNESNQNKSV